MRCRTKHETRKRTRTIRLRIVTFQHRVGRGARPIMDFTHTGIKGMSPETSSTMSRVPSTDDERCQLSASIVADIRTHSSSAPLTTLCFTCFSVLHLPCGPDYRPEFCTCLNEGKLLFALSAMAVERPLAVVSTSVQLNCQRGFGFRSLQHRSREHGSCRISRESWHDTELNSGRRSLPCNHELLFRRDFRNLFLVKIHVGSHSFRGQTSEPIV
jgi:hypothetical protein